MDQCRQTLNIKQWKNLPQDTYQFYAQELAYITHFNKTELSCLLLEHYVQQTTHFLFHSIFVDHTSVNSFYKEKTLKKKKKKIDYSQAALIFQFQPTPCKHFLLLFG